MRIACVYFGNHKRGCWKRLSFFLSHLLDEGHEVTLIISQVPQSIQKRDNLKLVVLPFKERGIFGLLTFTLLSSIVILFQSLKRKNDRLIAFDCHNALSFVLVKLFQRTPLILFIRGFYQHQDRFKSQNGFTKNLIKILNYTGYKIADRVRYVSEANKGDMMRAFGKHRRKAVVVRNNIINLIPSKTHNRVPAAQNVSQTNDFIIGYLGQIVKRKNVGFLIEVISKCKSQNIKLIIQGEGDEREILESKVRELNLQDRVTFLGWHDNVQIFFSMIDAFVLPSHYDDASNSLIEAISVKKIVFASNRGGNAEILKYNEDLLFCPLNGQTYLSHKLDILANDDNYRRKISNHIELCQQELIFDWNACMKKGALLA